MKFQTIHDIGAGQGAQIEPGNWVACAIACSSDVDVCKVQGHRLGVGSIVPCREGDAVAPVRGVRTLPESPLSAERVGGVLVLQLYAPCDLLIPPGPRAPLLSSNRTELPSAIPEGPDGAWVSALRLPFSGRDRAVITIQNPEAALDIDIVIRGIRYQTPEMIAKGDGPGSVLDEETDTVWAGSVSTPESSMEDDALLGRTIYIEDECFDEIEVWLSVGGGMGTPMVDVTGEATGERTD